MRRDVLARRRRVRSTRIAAFARAARQGERWNVYLWSNQVMGKPSWKTNEIWKAARGSLARDSSSFPKWAWRPGKLSQWAPPMS